jgi:SAM-dependent methyltransferase
MFDIPKPKTENQHESTWDHHGSYQWTYFNAEIKKKIQFFLLQRLNGRNIEVGGGWYLSYPDSVVVDLSSVCLEHNPAKEKLQFDLDTIGKGEKLPYEDNSFNSATLISVWQYLRHPKAVLGELERILKPGGEIYLIHGQGAGLQECVVGCSRMESLQEFFQEWGYDTLVEHIPAFDGCPDTFKSGNVDTFQSVCVAMPNGDLFGVRSSVKNKTQRKEKDDEIRRMPSIFDSAYVDWEMRNISERLARLATFPVTRYSQEYLERVEEFSQEFHKQTGHIPLVFAEHGFQPELAMLTPGYRFFHGTIFIRDVNEGVDKTSRSKKEELLKRFDLGFVNNCTYFYEPTINSLLKSRTNYQPQRDSFTGPEGVKLDVRRFVDFISSLGLNSFTRELQQQIYGALQPIVSDLDDLVQRQRAFGYHLATYEHKQKRKIDDLIKIKREIEQGVPIVGTRDLDYKPILPVLRKILLKNC